MADLRYEIGRIFEDFGSYALLVRNDSRVPCKCIDKLSLSAKDSCKVCLGTGYINRAERVVIRSKATSSSDTLPKIVNFTNVGDIGVALRQFFMKHNVRPKKKDLLVICEWDGLKPVFDEYTEIYEINNAEPLRGDGGRIEFFQVTAKSDPVNMKMRFNNLQENAGQLTYYITAG